MSMESDLYALLAGICPRTYPDVAPANSERPYLVWQQIGGESLRYADNTAMDKRFPVVQIAAWSESRLQSLSLIRQVEDALCASTAFTAQPQGEPISQHEPETGLYGNTQRFAIFAPR